LSLSKSNRLSRYKILKSTMRIKKYYCTNIILYKLTNIDKVIPKTRNMKHTFQLKRFKVNISTTIYTSMRTICSRKKKMSYEEIYLKKAKSQCHMINSTIVNNIINISSKNHIELFSVILADNYKRISSKEQNKEGSNNNK